MIKVSELVTGTAIERSVKMLNHRIHEVAYINFILTQI